MDKTTQRRVFLSSIVGLLIGGPFAIRYFSHRKPSEWEIHQFSRDLEKYREATRPAIQAVGGTAPFSLELVPPIGREWKYLIFSPSFLPPALSSATDGEPDAFVVREGTLFLDKTKKGQVVIGGGDSLFKIYTPVSTEERPCNEIMLLVQDGKLFPAKSKGKPASDLQDVQFQHLLGLESFPAQQELTVGSRWQGKVGRVKPFENVETDYEMTGFAEIDGRRTVAVRFSGTMDRFSELPGDGNQLATQGVAAVNTHRGSAWFDLETGFLARQETLMTTTVTGLKGYNGDMAVNAELIVQIYPS